MKKRCVIWCAVSSEEQAKDDKLSLVTQQNDMTAYAEAQGWEIVRVFMWDGYSRWESDPVSALEDFAEQGRFEYHELRRMWQERAFDVLLLYTHSRAGRSFTMQSWVVENVIRHGGEIYRIHGGWINKHDYAFQIGIGGVLATNDIDRLVEQRRNAMNHNAMLGLPTSSKPPLSHLVLRGPKGKPLADENGRPLPMVVDERLRRLWEDAAALFLEGVSYKTLELELFQRFGHVASDGKPYKSNIIRSTFLNPNFWGHSARFFKDGRRHGFKIGSWVYDESEPAPDGVLLHRNTHEPVYKGEIADRVRAEIRRRETVSRGRASRGVNRFTGLFICGECTYYLGYDRRSDKYGTYTYLYCGARNIGIYRSVACSQKTGTSEPKAQAFIDTMLQRVLDANALAAAFDDNWSDLTAPARRIDQIETELADLEQQAHRLVLKQASSPDNLSHIYDAEIRRIGERHSILKSEIDRVTYAEQRARAEHRDEAEAINDIRKIGLPDFWQLPNHEINQLLHRLLGVKRLVVIDGEILKRFARKPPTKRKKPSR